MRSSQHLIQSGARTSHCCVPCTYNPAGKLLAETWLPAGTPGKTGFSLQGHNSCWSTAASFRKMMSPAGGAEWRCDWSEHQHPVCDVTYCIFIYMRMDQCEQLMFLLGHWFSNYGARPTVGTLELPLVV